MNDKIDSFLVGRADVREDEFGKRGGAMRHGGEDATPMGLGICWGGPRVGLRASGQPWALGRNPFGIGGCGGVYWGGVGGPRAMLWYTVSRWDTGRG